MIEKTENAGEFGLGLPNAAYQKYFVGNSYLNPVVTEPFGIYNVTLSRSVATTGTFTMRKRAADKSCCAQPARGGFRSGASLRDA